MVEVDVIGLPVLTGPSEPTTKTDLRKAKLILGKSQVWLFNSALVRFGSTAVDRSFVDIDQLRFHHI